MACIWIRICCFFGRGRTEDPGRTGPDTGGNDSRAAPAQLARSQLIHSSSERSIRMEGPEIVKTTTGGTDSRVQGPQSSSQLIHSWSERSLQLCLDQATTLDKELKEQDPGKWLDAYKKGLRTMFEEQVDCDVFFSFPGGSDLKIGAHRCILEARNFQPLLKATKIQKNDEGQDEVLLDDTFEKGYREELCQAIASVYGILSNNTVVNKDYLRVSPRMNLILDDLRKMDPYPQNQIDPLKEILLELFDQQQYWTIRGVKEAVANANGYMLGYEFERILQILLKEVGVYHIRGRQYELIRSKLEANPPQDNDASNFPAPDVRIVASPNASPTTQEEWSLQAHKALLSAHSDYFRSLLTHEGWSFETRSESTNGSCQPAKEQIILRLDSTQFSMETMSILVSCCYGAWIFVPTLESRLDLIRGAAYLGMEAASLLFEATLVPKIDECNLASLFQFSEDHGAKILRLQCQKYLCRNLDRLRTGDSVLDQMERGVPLAELPRRLIENMLRSNYVNAHEDAIFDLLITWADLTGATFDDTKELLLLVRLPFVPVDSRVMSTAITKNLVGEDMLRICRLFQTDGAYRATMLNSETMYRPRMPDISKQQIQLQLRPPPLQSPFGGRMRPPPLRLRSPFGRRMVCRMLGTVNGRENFHRINSIRMSECGDKLLCAFSPGQLEPEDHDLPFGDLRTEGMPTEEDSNNKLVDRARLEMMTLEEAKNLLAAMLKRENSLRLHPRVQSVFGSLGEDERAMSHFTTALQRHVATEFNVDPVVGIEFLRSATTLFPDTAKLAHYVRHNRCFKGNLRIGDEAPDVNLLTLDGERTSLWNEIEKYQTGVKKPVIILGASYT